MEKDKKNNIKKQVITFHDRDNNKINIEIELNENRFSMSGDCGRSCGQCYDEIKPTPNQEKLMKLWKQYHLNDMNAGTIEQEKCLEKCKSKEYENHIKFLKKHHLYTVILEDGTKYKYGSGWLKRKLPDDIWDQVINICDAIKKDEETRKQEYIKKDGSWDALDKKIQALGKFLEMTPKEAEENIKEEGTDGNTFNAEGITYFVGNENEVTERCKGYLTDDTYIYQSWVEQQIKQGNASGIMNIDDWADYVINSDGYGSILNGWDGSEEYSTEYELYIIRTS